MRRVILLFASAALMPQGAAAQTRGDSLKVVDLDAVTVNAVRAHKTTPMATSTVGRDELRRDNVSRDLPWLLQQTPSVIVTSDNGLGIGTTYFRVRGADNSRVNFTFDGVPMNDSEDQAVFWANMNSFAASLDNIQIQRGVGTSTNGAGAFGATVSMKSAEPSLKPYVWLNGSWGMYNTYKYDVMGGSGLLDDHWMFDGRYSQTYTGGYIDRTAGHLRSYAASATYYGRNFFVRYRNFGSGECVQQSWNGITPDEMDKYGRRYNSLGKYTDVNGQTAYYPTTDNYWQNHNYLTFVMDISPRWKTNLTLHYTHGSGYYDDLKADAKLYKFGLENFKDATGTTVKTTDLIRQKGLENDFFGGVYNLTYTHGRLDAAFGAGFNHFDGDHWGEVTWARNYPNLELNAHYYDSNAKKSDYNFFLKGNYAFTRQLSGFLDLQYRGVDYRMTGNSDKFYTDAAWNNIQQTLDVDKHWNFFNPKVGLSYEQDGHHAYASMAVAHREPTRNNFTDNGQFDPAPEAETLFDYEAGYTYTAKKWSVGANFYYMHYNDQLILNGQTSDIGEALTVNVPSSYRMGVELTAAWQICRQFGWSANATLSRNKIKNFTETLLTYDAAWNELAPTVTDFGNTDIAFSPRATFNNGFHFASNGFTASLLTHYVGRQYLDNTQTKSRSLDAYCISNLKLGYTLPRVRFAKEMRIGLDINNLFNHKYESNGGAGGEVEDGQKVYWTWLFPQAGTTVMGTVSLKF